MFGMLTRRLQVGCVSASSGQRLDHRTGLDDVLEHVERQDRHQLTVTDDLAQLLDQPRRTHAEIDLVRFEPPIAKPVERGLVDVEADVLEAPIGQRFGRRRVAAADVEHQAGLGVALVEQGHRVGVAGVRLEVARIGLLA